MARPRVHLAVAAGLSALQFLRTRRLLPSLAPFITGFLVDTDHLLDRVGSPDPDKVNQSPVRLVLHGWELVPILAWLEARVLGGRTGLGLVLGFIVHLAVDQLANRVQHPLSYSLTFRATRRFDPTLFGGKHGERRWRNEPLATVWRWF